MVFERSKSQPSATKLADNLNDLCKKLNAAIEKKKDLKAAKFVAMYDKCCILRSQLEGMATKLLDSNNTKDFDYVANISHRSSRILSNFERLTCRPNYQANAPSQLPPSVGNAAGTSVLGAGQSNSASAGDGFADFSRFDTMVDRAVDAQSGQPNSGTQASKTESDSDWANFNDGPDDFKSKLSPREPGPKYRKDYMDTNLDTSVDHFNTSLDHHNSINSLDRKYSFDRNSFDEYPQEDERVGVERESLGTGRRETGQRRGQLPSSRGQVGPNRDAKLKHRGRLGEADVGVRTPESKLVKSSTQPHWAAGEARDANFVVGRGKPESPRPEARPEERPESREEAVEYIALLERFLAMTKYNSIVNRLNEHGDLRYKLELLQSYYNATYEGAPQPGSKTAFERENEVLKGMYNSRQSGAGLYTESTPPQLSRQGQAGPEPGPREGAGLRLLEKSNLKPEGGALATYEPGRKRSFRDEQQLLGKEIEPLWRSENDGGLSNYLSNFLLNSDYKLLSTSKYEIRMDLNQLNRDDFVLNLQMSFLSRINIASLNLLLVNNNVNYNYSGHDRADRRGAGGVYGGEVALVTERPLASDNSLTINLKVDLSTVTHFPLLVVRLVENDGTRSELRLSLPVGLFLSLVPLKYRLDQFENFWNSMELTVNRQIRLFLSKRPLDLHNLVNLLWKFFSVYLQDDVLLLSSCGTEVLLGSVFVKQSTLVVVQLRCICNDLIASTMGLLKELFSTLSTRYDASISSYTLKRVSALPLKFQTNVQISPAAKSITNYQ